MFKKMHGFMESALSRFFYALPLCFVAGALAALAMPPVQAWYLLPLCFGVLYLALHIAQSNWRAAAYGWVFGFGYFVFGLSWIGNALLVEGNPYAWAWPLAVSGLPAVLAIFTAVSCALSKRFFALQSLGGFFGFVGMFSLFEWLRGHLFTGFPWNLFGYSWAGWPPMYQILYLSDAYFLSLLTVFWACAFGFMLLGRRRELLIVAGVVLVTFGATYSYGQIRLMQDEVFNEDVVVKIVQPNIPQSEKWRRDKMMGHFASLLELSKAEEETEHPAATTYIIWPETALSFLVANDPGAMGGIRQVLSGYSGEAVLLTGMLRYMPEDGSYANSLVMIDKAGSVSNVYDKSHLVPFGEYIPFQKYIPLTPIVQFQGFKPGDGPVSLSTPQGHSYSPLVCYEILFPHAVTEADSHPDFIVNVTNDGWYGDSAGPRQHLTQALYRAVETGIPVIRAANTGISAIITPKGRYQTYSQLFSSAADRSVLPVKLENPALSKKLKVFYFLGFCLLFCCFGLFQKVLNTNSD